MASLAREPDEAPSPSGAAAISGWLFAALAIAYAVVIHHGVGPATESAEGHWARPTAFLLRSEALTFAFASTARALAIFAGPAVALSLLTFATSRSAIARAVGLCGCVATILFVFYGVAAPRPWAFFESRGSATLVLTALWIGTIAATPWLAARWLELGATARIASYLPVAFAAVAFIRNSTGTDATARFSLSPWPAVAVFGIEVAGLFFAAAFLGVAVATAGLAASIPEMHAAQRLRRLALGLLGLAIPVGLISLGAASKSFPFALGAPTLIAVTAACALAIGAVAVAIARDSPGSRRRRARVLVVGAALIAGPLIAGQALARVDYQVTRDRRAQRIIDALDGYYARERLYPDALSELVTAGDIEAVPTPAIGFRLLGGDDFHYQSFGTSYLLDFAAPRWVECAYSPPFDDEEDGDDIDPADEPLGGSWSCPSEPPELW